MTDQYDGSENLSLPSQLSNPADAVDPIDKILAAFPLKIDKQAFVVGGGAPLQADGDDEFLSFKKVNAALSEIRALAGQARAALDVLIEERAALLELREVVNSTQPAEADRIVNGYVILDGMAFSKVEILEQRKNLCDALESLSVATAERNT